jgi:uncharacterized membrane protein YkoI
MNKGIVAALIGVVAAAGASGVALAHGSKHPKRATAWSAPQSRLDDGQAPLPQAKIAEQQAIAAAQSAASGPLDEVDLVHYQGRLAWNVDVGRADVKVDAADGDVLAAPHDDAGGEN